MLVDVHIRKADSEECCRYHRADEGRAVSADCHRCGDRERRDPEALSDADHDRKHSVEVAVGVERECERHGKDTDDERQMTAEDCREEGTDQSGHAGDDARGPFDLFYKDTHEDSRRHQSRTHGQCRTRMIVDDDIKHSGICHDPEVQDAEYEQCRCRAGAGKAALDEFCKVVPGVVSGKNEDHTEDHRECDKSNTGECLALKKGNDDGNDTYKTKNTD